MSSTTKNIFYVILQQFIMLFLPLLTIPYVSRVLEPSGVGIVGYSTSIVMLFINLALLGSELYGVKEVAKVRNDKGKLSQIFSEIFILRLSLLVFATIIYISMTHFYFSNKILFYFQAINLIAYMIDINWFYQGMEQFKKILYRNLLIKSIGFISIFIFVKDKNDVYIYAIILALSILIGNSFMWFKLMTFVGSFKRIAVRNIKKHFTKMLALFVAGFSIMIYILTDKIMLGILSTTTEVGLYEQGQKIINVLVTIATAFSAVMLPKAAQIIKEGKLKDISKLINQSISIISFIVLPICIIFLLLSSEFIPWFLGEEFQKSTTVGQILAPLIFIKAIGVMLGSTYFIPMEKNKEYTIPLVAGAIVNIVLNFILIPQYGAMGSSISTLLTELMILIIQLIFLRNIISLTTLIKKGLLKYIIANIVMVVIVLVCKTFIHIQSDLLNILCYGLLSVFIYLILMVIFKDQYTKSVYNMVLSKVRK
ncbi:hypothetical protein CJ195_11395 [Bacillus sp. UMB0899]|nr:hypothetical protein CJ195_11395 [Bacillus sp. UMB0899]